MNALLELDWTEFINDKPIRSELLCTRFNYSRYYLLSTIYYLRSILSSALVTAALTNQPKARKQPKYSPTNTPHHPQLYYCGLSACVARTIFLLSYRTCSTVPALSCPPQSSYPLQVLKNYA